MKAHSHFTIDENGRLVYVHDKLGSEWGVEAANNVRDCGPEHNGLIVVGATYENMTEQEKRDFRRKYQSSGAGKRQALKRAAQSGWLNVRLAIVGSLWNLTRRLEK